MQSSSVRVAAWWVSGILLILVVLGLLAYLIVPVRTTITEWWNDREEQKELEALAELEAELPQGDLTSEEKRNLLAD